MTSADPNEWIRPGERLDDLQRGTLRILQRPDGFCFGMDSVLLAAFASARCDRGMAVDLGTGSGVLPLLLCARRPLLRFDAVELQPDIADMASRSMRINGMEDRVRIHAMDLREAPGQLGHERYRLAVCNPPYGAGGCGPENPDAARRAARHEMTAAIGDICAAAGALLQNGGRFAVVFPAPRLLALMDAMRSARLEPKYVQMIHPAWDKPPNLVLVEAMKAAKPMLHFLPPVYVRDADGHETEMLRRIYET
ncbi:methyltransferase [Eubacteriales bacterium OttesenSCG-928-A19]|nr:methyltransferase [Eubacteriales bacterium OttesenSCG-928-A19]